MIPNHLKHQYARNILEVGDLIAREEEFRDREEQHDREKEQGSTSFGPRAISPYPHTGD